MNEFVKYSITKQTLLFNKKLCKYCRNRVDSQERICTHYAEHTYENKHRRVIVYKSNNYKS